VLSALAGRLTNAEVAARLCVSERTVESHVSSLLRKLGAANRLELAALANEVQVGGSAPLASALPPEPSDVVPERHDGYLIRAGSHVPPDVDDALVAFLADLAPLATVARVHLGGLDVHEVARLIGVLRSDEDELDLRDPTERGGDGDLDQRSCG
jgi:hypothetical protein